MKGKFLKFLKYCLAGAAVLSAALVPLFAQETAPQKVEVFSEGEKFPSLDQYRLHRRMLESAQTPSVNGLTAEAPVEPGGPAVTEVPVESASPVMESSAYINNFLDSTLKSFNDEELKLILHELRKRRSDLFAEGGRSYSLEMKEMLNTQREQSKDDIKLELDPSRVKTIIFPDDGIGSKSILLGDPDQGSKKPVPVQDSAEPSVQEK